MKRLLLLRHATAAAQGSQPGDRQRPLTPGGRAEAARLLPWLRQRNLQADLVLCSPALRTVETWEAIETSAPDATVLHDDRLYLGSPSDYWRAVAEADGQTVLLVGHNPTCAAIAMDLRPADGLTDQPLGHYPPATLCVAQQQEGGWIAVDFVRGGSLPEPLT